MLVNVNRRRVLWVALIAVLLLAAVAPLGRALAQGPTRTPGSNDFELVGLITAVAPGSFVVNGVMVFTAGAELKVQPQVGIAVKVHGRLQPDQSIAAREVELVGPDDLGVRPDEAELVGVMTSFVGTTMLVNGVTVDVSTAEIHGRLDPGGLVWVHATWDGTRNVWVAREVGPFAATRDVRDDLARFGEGESELVGTLTAWTPQAATISGLVVDIQSAEIDDHLTLGALVKVELRLLNGQLVATELERASQDRLRDSLMTRGRAGAGGFDDDDNGNDNDDNGNSNFNGNGNDNDDDDDDDNRNGNGNDNDDDDNGNGNDNDDDDDDDNGGRGRGGDDDDD